MSPLRQRLIDDLRLRNYSPRTIEAYTAGVARLAKHFYRSPDQLGVEDLLQFQLQIGGIRRLALAAVRWVPVQFWK